MATSKKSTSKKKTTSKASSTRQARGAKSTKKVAEPVQAQSYYENNTVRYVLGIVFLAVAVLVTVSFFVDSGKFIIVIAGFFNRILGLGYYVAGLSFLLLSWILLLASEKQRSLRAVCAFFLPVFFSCLIALFGPQGGSVGNGLASLGSKYLSSWGFGIIVAILLIFCVFKSLGATSDSFKQKPRAPKPVRESAPVSFEHERIPTSVPAVFPKRQGRKSDVISVQPVGSGKNYDIPLGDEKPVKTTKSRSHSDISLGVDDEALKKPQTKKTVPVSNVPVNTSHEKPKKVSSVEIVKPLDIQPDSFSDAEDVPKKVSKAEIAEETKAVAREIDVSAESGNYIFPDTGLLKKSKNNGSDSNSLISETKQRLENALHSFGVNSYVTSIIQGPTVTRYDIELEQGVKLNKVTNLSGDIALALGASTVRIAPIPNEISTVGIEVPNKIVNIVSLREIIESSEFTEASSKLTFAIGKDIGGKAIVGDISKLPHMLIAGTTGSGKSVCMNSLIISLLYKAKPDELKFIMIDPKMVELGIYNSIPHLLVPVVTEPKKAAGALQWAVVEMIKRYRLFSEKSVRDLQSYNECCVQDNEPTLPRVVIVIDELADLMMAASKEVEESICRLAQMGRAAGMHLVIATQRPSVNVITGLMKANIPSRIAFAVSSAMESRIILDLSGAEKLVGHGDMLYMPLGCGKPTRIQGSFVSDEERENVIKFIKDNCDCKAEINQELKDAMEQSSSGDSSETSESKEAGPSGDYDEMLPKAVEVVLEMKNCSVSMLQRRLKLGYSRAARIVDQMEELGIVGEYQGAKPRDVIVDRDGWNEIQVNLGLASEDDFAMASEMSEKSDSDEGFDEYDE